ncbi:heterokaryon incompatibility domain-containing protein [Trichoderma sp. SZMC 28014]
MAFNESDLQKIAKRFPNYNPESWLSGGDSGRNSGNSRNPDGVHIDEDCSQYATKSNSDRSTVYIADIRNTTRMPNIKKGNLFSRNGYSSGGRGLGGARGGTAGEPTNVVELFSRSAPMLVGDIRDAEALERAQRQENDQLQYLGEYMVSKFFAEKLGALYNPNTNWANHISSSTRCFAQWAPAPTAAFTFTGTAASQKLTELLYEMGNPGINNRKRTSTNYRIEITVSPSNTESDFTISPQQFIRIQPHQSRNVGTSSVEEVTVLMCLIASGHIGLSSSSTLNAYTTKPLYHAPSFQLSAPVVEGQAPQEVGESQVANGIRYMADLFTGLTIGGTRLPRIEHANNAASPYIPSLTRGERTVPISLNQQWWNFPPYEYNNLEDNHFRLLRIYPGAKNDQLQGLIFTWPLNKQIKYNALSYVWGKESQLTLTLFTVEGHIRVPQSTHEALKRVRREEDAITVWIDAICINQEDSQEKARQIPLLPEIFQNARSTIALVALDNESHAAVTFLRHIYTEYSSQPVEQQSWPKDVPHLPSPWRERLVPPNGDPIWEQLAAFFNRPWFRRAWIVQEVIVSRNLEVVCGEKLIPWKVIEQAMDIINDNVDPAIVNMAALNPFRQLSDHRAWEHKQYRWCLFHLLESYRHVQSTLMRDRFFALIGLASDANIQEFEPDYNKKTQLEDIVCRLAKVFVEQGRGIALLHRAGLDTKPSRFPSWVPNWTVPKQSGLYGFRRSRGVKFNASRGESEQLECQSDKRTLAADGYIFDSIKKMGTKTMSIKSLDDFFCEIDTMIENLDPSIPDTEQARIKWQVPIAGALEPKIAIRNVNLEGSYQQLRKALELIRDKSTKEQDEMLQAIQKNQEAKDIWYETRAYTSLLIDDLEGWKFIITQRNYCGLAPSRTECGDQVSIICGGTVPFLIRGDEATGFRLVGEIYVDGMMHGKALDLDNVAKTTISMY